MSMTVESLVEQARLLPQDEQAILSERLFEMISPPDLEWDAEWAEECHDRMAAIVRGEMETIDSDELMARLRSKHGLK